MKIETQKLAATLHNLSKEFMKDPDNRSEDLEDQSIAWTLREAAKRLKSLEATIEKLKLKKP